jgi:hypothetical protein
MGRRTVLVLLVATSSTLGLSPPTVAAEDTPAPAPVPTPAPEPAPAPVPTPDNSKSSLTLLGGQLAAQTVTLSRREAQQKFRGTLVVSVRSTVNADGLGISYFPAGDTSGPRAGSVQLEQGFASELKAEHAKSIPLVFTMPGSASPRDLSGIVVLQPLAGGKAKGHRFELSVTGTAAALKGVSIQPEKVVVKVVGGLVSWHSPSHTSAGVQLAGPGVPSLFAAGAAPPSLDLLLRSDNGDEAHATLTGLTQSKTDPAVATGEVEVDGDLGPGKYEGAASISSLSPDAPKLSVTLESGNSFVLALLVVFVGAVIGGALYLASNRRRRKELLRDQVKSLLDNYESTLKQVKANRNDAELPLWTLETYLGKDTKNWYRVKWNAVLDFDGAVQTTWSNIHWAKAESDLDEVAEQVADLRARIVRWVTVANSIAELERVTKLEPKFVAGNSWSDRKTPRDTERLLELIREIEPADDKAAKDLIDRINRQSRWHETFAEAWHARAVLTLDMTNNRGKYDTNADAMLKTLDLERLDTEACPESKRSAETQVDLKLQLVRYMEQIKATYKGPADDLKLPGPAAVALPVAPAPTLTLVATAAEAGGASEAIVEEGFTESDRKEPQLRDRLRGTSASGHNGKRNPVAVGAIAKRDFFWTFAIALVSSAAYIPTFYTPTWGTAADYVGAFAAGFLGKAAINWAALPLFQSLRPSKAASAEATAPASASSATTTVATPAAPAAPVAPPSAPAAS